MKALNVQSTKSAVFSLLIFSSLFFTQCKNETKQTNYRIGENVPPGFVKITGYIHNRDFYPNTKDINMIIPHISGENRVSQFETPINDDNTFYFDIYLSRSQEVRIEPYLQFLYLIPGDSLHIEIDFRNLSDIRLSGGKSAEINREFHNYFATTAYNTRAHNYIGVGTDCEMNCSWNEIKKQLDEERNFYRNRRQAFLQNNKVSDEVVFMTEAMIELDYYNEFTRVWGNRKIRDKEIVEQQELMNELDEVMSKYFNSGLYSDAHFKFIQSSYMYISILNSIPSADINYMDWVKRVKEVDANFVDWVKETAKTEIIKDFMLTVRAGSALVQKDLESFETISSQVNNEYLVDRLVQEYRITRSRMLNPEDISASILSGSPSDFTNNLSLGNENMLAGMIYPNQGKVHVISIGAGWCAPCIADLEHYKTLMDEYAGKDVHFSFICISADNKETREKYRSIGIDDALVHFCTNEENRFLSKTLSLLAIPHGILINKKGVIVDNGTYVRPTNKLQEKIDLLLEQDNLVK